MSGSTVKQLRATFRVEPGDRFRIGYTAAHDFIGGSSGAAYHAEEALHLEIEALSLLGPPAAVLELLREAVRECEERMGDVG